MMDDVLPDEMLVAVFGMLPCALLAAKAARVSRRWRRIASDGISAQRLTCLRGPDRSNRTAWCRAAAQHGHLDCLRYARGLGCVWGQATCAAAARGGHVDCLAYIRSEGVGFRVKACAAAAGSGVGMACLVYMGQTIHALDARVCIEAARNGRLETVEYLFRHGLSWDKRVCEAAAEGGHLACLRYAHENGCPWDAGTCRTAARYGWVDCLRYAHENGCPWDADVCTLAAKHGHLGCLAYAHEHGCPWDWATAGSAIERGHIECLTYASESLRACTASCYGPPTDAHVACVAAACEHGGFNPFYAAVANGHLACLVLAVAHGYKPRWWVCAMTAKRGYVDMLRYMHENGATLTSEMGVAAALAGKVDVMAYLLDHIGTQENVCQWVDAAARSGRSSVLALLHARAPGASKGGFRGDSDVCLGAAAGGHVKCLRLLVDTMGYRPHGDESLVAAKGGHRSALRYATEVLGQRP